MLTVVYFVSCVAPYLSSLPKDSEEIVSKYTSVASQGSTFPTPQTPPLSIILYVLCNNLQSIANPTTSTSTLEGVGLKHVDGAGAASSSREERMECLKTIRAFSELLESENVPQFIRERIVLQVGFIKNEKYNHEGVYTVNSL